MTEPEHSTRATLAMFAGLGLFCAAYAYLYGWRLIGAEFIDLPSFWVGAKMAFAQAQPPYGPAFGEAAASLAPGYVHPFLYPPATLVLLAPLSALSLTDAGTAMLAVNLLCAPAIGVLLARLVSREGQVTPAALIVAGVVFVLAAQATRQTIGHGQVNLAVVLGLLAGLAAVRARLSPVTTGLFLALAILLKLYFGLVLLCLLLHGQWRAVLTSLAWLGAISIVSLGVVPAGSWAAWLDFVLLPSRDAAALAGQFDLASPRNLALSGVILRWAPEGVAEGLRLAATLTLLLATCGISLWRRRAGAEAPSLAEFGAYLCLVVLVAPNSWVHYMVFVLPAAMAVAWAAWRFGSIWLIVLAAGGILVLLQNPARLLGGLVGAADLLALVCIAAWALAGWVAIKDARTGMTPARATSGSVET
ncbi:MAG: glycosyltransferase family 87 protein [Pseudomonadota bacterium]